MLLKKRIIYFAHTNSIPNTKHKMKRKLILTALGILIGLPIWARDFQYTYEGQTITYTVIDEEMKECSTKECWYDENSGKEFPGNQVSGKLVLPATPMDGNTKYNLRWMGGGSFCDCSGLTEVTLPNSLYNIGSGAFSGCTGLTKVSIPNSVTRIDWNAFGGCSNLTEVIIPNSVQIIDRVAFSNCSSLKTVTIPKSVQAIYDSAFAGCSSLGSVTCLSNNPALIEEGSFPGLYEKVKLVIPEAGALNYVCSKWILFKNIFLAESGEAVSTISDGTLNYVLIPSSKADGINYSVVSAGDYEGEIDIPESISYNNRTYYVGGIGWKAFCKNKVLNVSIPNTVILIADYAFNSTPLKNLTLPESVASIGTAAFQGCFNLKEISIPGSVNLIYSAAFADCRSLNSVRFEDSPTPLQIPNNVFVFNNKPRPLDELYIGRNLTNSDFRDLGYRSPELRPHQLIIGNLVTDPFYRFSQNEGLTNLTLGSGMTEIPDNIFNGCSLEEVVVPVNVTTIGWGAFGNNKLSKVSMGSNVTVIQDEAFNGNPISQVNVAALTPPEASESVFSDYGQLFVPAESIGTYGNTSQCWGNFESNTLVALEDIKGNGESISGKVGDTVQLSVTLIPENVTLPYVFWYSTNPNMATVDNNGLVTMVNKEAGNCKIIATTLYANSKTVEYNVVSDASGVFEITSDDRADDYFGVEATKSNDIFTLEGVCLKRNATKEDVDALAPGLYIVAGKKVVVK